jgi:hypothetical protein
MSVSVVVLYLTIILVALHISKSCHSSISLMTLYLSTFVVVEEVLQRMSAVTRRGGQAVSDTV